MLNDITVETFVGKIERYISKDYVDFYKAQIQDLTNCIKGLANYIADESIHEEVKEVLSIYGYK